MFCIYICYCIKSIETYKMKIFCNKTYLPKFNIPQLRQMDRCFAPRTA